VGLNEESFLLLDTEQASDGRLYPRFTSVGEKDGVYVFDPSGQKIRVDYGGEVIVPGTRIWEEHYRNDTQRFLGIPCAKKYEGETLWAE
jgi:hypothetical protein